jgi:hypothetical protein
MKDTSLIGSIPVSGTDIALITTELNSSDFLGAVMVRYCKTGLLHGMRCVCIELPGTGNNCQVGRWLCSQYY